jgi:hypothetical protein
VRRVRTNSKKMNRTQCASINYLIYANQTSISEPNISPNRKANRFIKRGPSSLWLPGRRINYILFIIAYEKERETRPLQDLALVLPAGFRGRAGVEDGSAMHHVISISLRGHWGKTQVVPDSLVKHALQVALSERGALEILMCADLLGDGQGLLVRDGLHLAGAQGFGRGAVISQVELGADQDDGDVGGVVFDLGVPLILRSDS